MTRCENGHGAGGVNWSGDTAHRGCHCATPNWNVTNVHQMRIQYCALQQDFVYKQPVWRTSRCVSEAVNAPFAACGNNEPTGDGWWRLLYVSATFAAWLSANAFTFMLKGLSQCLSITWALFWHVVMKCYSLVGCVHWSVNVHVVFTSADPSLYCDGG